MSPRPNVVITGVGVISPIGIGSDAFWAALCDGRSGVRVMPRLAETAWPVRIGAPVADFEPKQYVKPRKALKVMSREIQLGFSAATMASEQARLTPDQMAGERLGVLFGSEMLYCEPTDMVSVYLRCMASGQFEYSDWGTASMSEMYPLWMLMYLPNMTACHIGIAQDARGPNNTICAGEASGLLAVIEAAQIIQRGEADAMIAGASSSRINVTPMVYRGAESLSHCNDAPERTPRPFDAGRDGTVNGEGAAAIVLESESHARARGVPILARLAGWHASFGSPAEPVAYQRVLQGALRSARLDVTAIDHVNAHAGGCVEGDSIEAQAIQQVLADVPVLAPKSYFGNLGPAGSVVELAASLLAIARGTVPRTLNYETPDPRCPVHVICDQPKPLERPAALALSHSGTGQTTAVIVQRP